MSIPFPTPEGSLHSKNTEFVQYQPPVNDVPKLNGFEGKISLAIKRATASPVQPTASSKGRSLVKGSMKSAQSSSSPAKGMPIHLLPAPLQEIIEALKVTLKFHPEYTTASMLAAASIAIGNSRKASIKAGWESTAVIYVALVGPPGIGKTHPLKTMMEPIRKRDDQSYKVYKEELERYRANEKAPQDQKNPALAKPVWQKYILSDVTAEAVAVKHMDNLRGMGVCVDELAGWFKNFERYNKGGSEQEMWLSNWSNQPINVDRKSSEPIYIKEPFISVIGTIQPGVLQRMGSNDRDSNGFLDRILNVCPDGLKKEYWSDAQLPPYILEDWDSIVARLLDLKPGSIENGTARPIVLHFLPEAKELLSKWQISNTDKCNIEPEYKGIGAKMEDYALRLSLIFQCLFSAVEGKEATSIGIEAVRAAVEFTDYFAKENLKVRGAITGSDPLVLLEEQYQKFYNDLPETFETSKAVATAEKLNISERTAKRFLKKNDLFKRLAHGVYSKLI